MSPTIQIVFDANDPHTLARFWAAALRYDTEDHTDVAACSDPASTGPRLFFQRVPEPKVAKNRVHLDIQVGADAAEGEVERLVALGASVAWTTSDRGPVTTTLRDPEGNELCVS